MPWYTSRLRPITQGYPTRLKVVGLGGPRDIKYQFGRVCLEEAPSAEEMRHFDLVEVDAPDEPIWLRKPGSEAGS